MSMQQNKKNSPDKKKESEPNTGKVLPSNIFIDPKSNHI